jgi:predicted DNA-binding ribbon-helix-helix protein
MVSTRLEEPVFEALGDIARDQDRKIGYLVRKAVEQFVRAASRNRKLARASSGG